MNALAWFFFCMKNHSELIRLPTQAQPPHGVLFFRSFCDDCDDIYKILMLTPRPVATSSLSTGKHGDTEIIIWQLNIHLTASDRNRDTLIYTMCIIRITTNLWNKHQFMTWPDIDTSYDISWYVYSIYISSRYDTTRALERWYQIFSNLPIPLVFFRTEQPRTVWEASLRRSLTRWFSVEDLYFPLAMTI